MYCVRAALRSADSAPSAVYTSLTGDSARPCSTQQRAVCSGSRVRAYTTLVVIATRREGPSRIQDGGRARDARRRSLALNPARRGWRGRGGGLTRARLRTETRTTTIAFNRGVY